MQSTTNKNIADEIASTVELEDEELVKLK